MTAQFMWGMAATTFLLVGLALTFPNLNGDARTYHRRACAAEFRAAKSSADTLRVVLKDAYCGARMGKDS